MAFPDSRYEKRYLPADTSFIVNDKDVDLRPIRISLPKPPDIRLIDGYGMHPDEQRFQRIEIPRKLALLEEDAKEAVRARSDKEANYTVTRFKLQKKYWDMFYERRE